MKNARILTIIKAIALMIAMLFCLPHTAEAMKMVEFSKTYHISIGERNPERLLASNEYDYGPQVKNFFEESQPHHRLKIATLRVPMNDDEISEILSKRGWRKGSFIELVSLDIQHPEVLPWYSEIIAYGSSYGEIYEAPYGYRNFHPVLREGKVVDFDDPTKGHTKPLPAGTHILISR